jgi:hypothetical protein
MSDARVAKAQAHNTIWPSLTNCKVLLAEEVENFIAWLIALKRTPPSCNMRSHCIAAVLFTAFAAASGCSLRGRKIHVEAAARALVQQKACKIAFLGISAFDI